MEGCSESGLEKGERVTLGGKQKQIIEILETMWKRTALKYR